MKERSLELLRCLVLHLGGLNMMVTGLLMLHLTLATGPVFSMRELGTDLKNRFSLLKSW